MPRMTIRERRQQRAAAMAHATRFSERYIAEHPRAGDTEVAAATKTELERAGFDISTIGAIIELIMALIAMFRKK